MTDELKINSKSTPSAEELMKKFDKDSKSRNFTGVYKIVYNVLFILFALFVLSTALIFKRLTTYTKLPLFLGFALFLGYIKFPACEKDAIKENYIPWYDIVLALLSLGSCLYYVFNQDAIIYSGGLIKTIDINRKFLYTIEVLLFRSFFLPHGRKRSKLKTWTRNKV